MADADDLARAEARPEVVALCGSTRFKDAFYEQGKRLTYEGRIVLGVADLDPRPEARGVNVPIPDDLKQRLDELHKRQIDMADRVLVLNVGGYIGESTRSEIDYAHRHGVPVDYLEGDPVSDQHPTAADVLKAHQPTGGATGTGTVDGPDPDGGWLRDCMCGAAVETLWNRDGDDWERPFAQHQADMLAAAGLLCGTEMNVDIFAWDAVVRAQALRDAADQLARGRQDAWYADWLRARADQEDPPPAALAALGIEVTP